MTEREEFGWNWKSPHFARICTSAVSKRRGGHEHQDSRQVPSSSSRLASSHAHLLFFAGLGLCVEGGKLQQNNLFAHPTAGPKQGRRNNQRTINAHRIYRLSAAPRPNNPWTHVSRSATPLQLQPSSSAFGAPAVSHRLSAHLPKPPSGGENDLHDTRARDGKRRNIILDRA